MKRIYNNSDIQIKLKSIRGLSDNFIIKFFTTNKEFFIRKTNENVYTVEGEEYIKLNWSELETIGEGVLNYVFNNIKDDSDYDDGEFNHTISRSTDYYICSTLKVDPETDKSISEVIAELSDSFDTEKTRSTNKDTEHDTAISELNSDLEIEADARGAADLTLQANIDSEATTRQNADTQLQSSINGKADIEDVYDKQTANSIFATQTVVNQEIAARLQRETDIEQTLGLKADKSDTYTKQEVDDAIPTVPQNVSAFTNDAGYLTEHQDISNLVTKEELKKINCGEY